jgi:hypothetical protein
MRFNSHPTAYDVSECKNQYGLDLNRYANYLVHNENFYKMLRIVLDASLRKQGKCLYFLKTNEAILVVRDWIYENYPELIGQVGIFTSLVNDPELKRQQLEKKIILTTTKSAGAAVDIKGLVETVNLADPFKSKIIAQQTLGRTRARNTVYKDLVDNGFIYTKKFYQSKKPIFSKYASECMEVNISDRELNEKSTSITEAHDRGINPLEFFDRNKIE